MTGMSFLQICIYFIALFSLSIPLGSYIAKVYEQKRTILTPLLNPVEKYIYQFCSIDPNTEMNWVTYLISMLSFNMIGILFVYLVQRFQYLLPLNDASFQNVSPDLAFNTAISFTTNTDWQAYAGEASLSYLTQMLALTPQNFFSAATGMALLVAFIRSIKRHESNTLGNFWVDLVRCILYILLPLALLLSIALVSQGVIQNFNSYQKASLIQPYSIKLPVDTDTQSTTNKITTQTINITEQLLPMGPAASQIAIKQLGTNGGGFFNTNSAHPFENPTPLSNFFEVLAILLIPTASIYAFGLLINDKSQAYALLSVMLIMFISLLSIATNSEQMGNPAFQALHINQLPHGFNIGGNMEGKEVRFGIVNSTLWTTATTATSNGSTNSALDSYMPLASLTPLWLMHLGEVIFGGIGSGIYGMLMLVIITVFISGLMIGRTPEYLGKKIEPYEIKMACLAVLVMPLTVLVNSAIAVTTDAGVSSIGNSGIHGFSEILYAFTSMGNNNGSAFQGLNTNTPFYNILGGLVMLIGRYWIAIPTLAIAGSLVGKKIVPNSAGTLATNTFLFVIFLAAITTILGALSFLPALALGPIVEQLLLWRQYGF